MPSRSTNVGIDHHDAGRPARGRPRGRRRRCAAARRPAAPPARCPARRTSSRSCRRSVAAMSRRELGHRPAARGCVQRRASPYLQDRVGSSSRCRHRRSQRDVRTRARGRARRGTPASCATSSVDRVAAEFLEARVGQHEGDHRLADDGGRRARRRRRCARSRPGSRSAWSRSTERSGFISVAIGFM